MTKHHSVDFKLTATKYYLKYGDLGQTCKIFNCKKSSLHRWVQLYNKYKHVNRSKTNWLKK